MLLGISWSGTGLAESGKTPLDSSFSFSSGDDCVPSILETMIQLSCASRNCSTSVQRWS
jgi:hypothetical protein